VKKLLQKLKDREQAGSLRKLTLAVDGTDFFSNDYLGLARSKELADLISEEFHRQQGNLNGSTGSRLLAGNSEYVENLENELAGFFGFPAGLIFNSGYNANMGVLASVPQKGDTIIYDELSHASLIDGARLSFARRYSFRHNDLEDLERLLLKAEGEKFVVIESIYSMDGDASPLAEIVALCEKYHACLIVDEAHSTGITGKNGKGIVASLGLQEKVFACIYTFGKAMGSHGACVAGSEMLRKYLINYARSFIYTTSLPVHSLISIKKSFEYLKLHSYLQKELEDNISTFRKMTEKLLESGRLINSRSAIQAVLVPGNDVVRALALKLMAMKFDLRPIFSPTVKEGEERLRICLHAFNTKKEIISLAEVLNENLVGNELFYNSHSH
jgi:8-amino-7-oxononanoate synthase